MTNFEKVGLFMTTFGQEVKKKPSFGSDKINNLRISLIVEELNEFKEAVSKKDLKEVADALTDILYVTYGAGHAFGINLDKCFNLSALHCLHVRPLWRLVVKCALGGLKNQLLEARNRQRRIELKISVRMVVLSPSETAWHQSYDLFCVDISLRSA